MSLLNGATDLVNPIRLTWRRRPLWWPRNERTKRKKRQELKKIKNGWRESRAVQRPTRVVVVQNETLKGEAERVIIGIVNVLWGWGTGYNKKKLGNTQGEGKKRRLREKRALSPIDRLFIVCRLCDLVLLFPMIPIVIFLYINITTTREIHYRLVSLSLLSLSLSLCT